MIPAMRSAFLPDLCAECMAKVKAAARAERERRREKTRGTRLAKVAKRATLREETAELRAKVVLLAGGKCERCGDEVAPLWGHMHHLYPGRGRRTQEQSVTNCAWLCGRCHDHFHAHPRESIAFRATIAEKRTKPCPF